PPRWREGDLGAGRGVRTSARRSRQCARRAARLRQYVGGVGAVRARTRAGARFHGAHADDRARAGLHRRLSSARRPRPYESRRGGVTLFPFVLALVALARLGELIIANRNTRALLAQGGVEIGRGQYPFIVALHMLWLLVMLFAIPMSAPVDWYWLGVFLVLQA